MVLGGGGGAAGKPIKMVKKGRKRKLHQKGWVGQWC